jgi:hypothetical protein
MFDLNEKALLHFIHNTATAVITLHLVTFGR